MQEFIGLIDSLELVDVPSIGRKFTWYNQDGGIMSKLYRFLLLEVLIQKWMIKDNL